MATIKFPCYGIVVELTDFDGKCRFLGGTISSDLKSFDTQEIEENFEDGDEHACYEAAIDALEALILAHGCAGVDIESPAYIEGIETAVEAISNNV